MVYDMNTDTLFFSNPTNEPLIKEIPYKNTVKCFFDIEGKPIGLEIIDASIVLGVPKIILKQLSEVRM